MADRHKAPRTLPSYLDGSKVSKVGKSTFRYGCDLGYAQLAMM